MYATKVVVEVKKSEKEAAQILLLSMEDKLVLIKDWDLQWKLYHAMNSRVQVREYEIYMRVLKLLAFMKSHLSTLSSSTWGETVLMVRRCNATGS